MRLNNKRFFTLFLFPYNYPDFKFLFSSMFVFKISLWILYVVSMKPFVYFYERYIVITTVKYWCFCTFNNVKKWWHPMYCVLVWQSIICYSKWTDHFFHVCWFNIKCARASKLSFHEIKRCRVCTTSSAITKSILNINLVPD